VKILSLCGDGLFTVIKNWCRKVAPYPWMLRGARLIMYWHFSACRIEARREENEMSAHQIKIITQEGDSVSFDCFEDEDIVSAGLRQEIYLMTSCREGGCATCKGLCTDGDYELGKVSFQALPTEEEENGYVLLCRCYPTSDMNVEVPYTYDRISFAPVGMNFEAEVVELIKVSSNVMKLQLQSPPDELQIRFDAGQFFDLKFLEPPPHALIRRLIFQMIAAN